MTPSKLQVLLQSDETLLFSEGHITIAKNYQSILQLLREKAFDLVVVEDLDLFDKVRKNSPKSLQWWLPRSDRSLKPSKP